MLDDSLLRALWGASQPGLRCVAFRGTSFKGLTQKWFDSTERAISFVHWLDARPGVEVVYHACAIYDAARVEAAQAADKANTGRARSTVGRLADNVLGAFALWCDVDIKPDKPGAGYPDMASARAAVRAFAQDFLTPSFVVASGGGLHLYWLCREFMAREEVLRCAERLKLLAKARGFRADPTRTADLASVLRPPGTLNRKYDPPMTVCGRDTGRRYTLEDFEAALAEIEPPEPAFELRAVGAPVDNSDLTENVYQPTTVRDVARGCRQIRESMLRRGAGDSEPLWKDVLRTLARCTDGSDAVLHRVSSGYEAYDPAEVQRKIEHVRTMGPATCASLELANPGGCDGCPHHGKDRFSPIRLSEVRFQIGTPVVASGSTQFVLPPEDPLSMYRFDFAEIDGVQCMRYQAKEPDLEGKLVWSNQWRSMGQTLYMLTGVERDYATGSHVGVYRFKEPSGRVFEARAGMKDLPEPKGLFQFLADSGVVVNTNEKAVRNAHIALNKQWLSSVQKTRPSTVVYDTFGWSTNDDGDLDGFVGAYHYHMDGTVTLAALRGGAKQMQIDGVRAKGDLNIWRSVVARFCRPGLEIQQMCLLLALFGPFVTAAKFASSFCPVSLVSAQGGQGKTTAASLALSAWARPGMFRTQIDSPMRRIKDAATMRHLPFVFDEMTTAKPADIAEIIYNISNGKERARLRSNGEQMPTSEVRLPLFMTANGTVRDALERALQAKADAAQTRVIEVEVRKDRQLERELVETRALDLLPENYGVAGDWWMRYVLGNSDGVNKLQQVIDEARQMLTRVERTLPDVASYRFFSINAATVLLGAKWVERTNFLPIRYHDMEEYIMGTLLKDQHLQRGRYQQDVVQYIADFLHDNMARVVEATIVRPVRKVQLGGEEQILRAQGHIEYAAVSPEPERFRGDRVVARWEVFFNRFPKSPATIPAETRILISKGAMRTYLNEHYCDVKTFVTACEEAGVLTDYCGTDNMSKPTQRQFVALEKKYKDNAPLVDCYVVDPSKHASLSDIVSGVVERAGTMLDNNT